MTRTAFVATYPPQLCGIATFTVAPRPPELLDPYPREVGCRIRRQVHGDSMRAATWLDASGSDVVSIQHDYGIWAAPTAPMSSTSCAPFGRRRWSHSTPSSSIRHHRATASLAQALAELAREEGLRQELGQRAYLYSQGMRWGEVAASYRRVFERAAPASAQVAPSVDPTLLLAAAGA